MLTFVEWTTPVAIRWRLNQNIPKVGAKMLRLLGLIRGSLGDLAKMANAPIFCTFALRLSRICVGVTHCHRRSSWIPTTMDIVNANIQHFDQLAAMGDDNSVHVVAEQVANLLRKLYEFDPQKTVLLDYACGSGVFLLLFHQF